MRRQFFAALLAPCLVLSAVPARAEMIETTQLLAPSADARVKVDAFLAREDVRRQLETFGATPADAEQRVASLTEAELQALSSRIDSLPAGGHSNTIVILLVIILIVLLI